MNADLAQKLDGKVLCSSDGGPIPITTIEFVRDTRGKDGDEFYRLEIGGVANAYLVNPTNPKDGAEELPEPLAVSQSHDLEKEDSEVFLSQINSHFGLKGDEALADDGGSWMGRFTEDGEKSIVPILRERGAYMKARLKQNADVAIKFGSPAHFFNFFQPPKRVEATTSNLKEIRELLKQKKETAQKKKAEIEDLLG